MATETKRQRKAKKIINLDNQTVTFELTDGGEPIVFDVNKLSGDMSIRAMLHGLAQKGGDAYASPDVDPRHALMEIRSDLYSGVWSTRGTGEPRTSIFAEALARIKSAAIDAVVNKLSLWKENGVTEDGKDYDEWSKNMRANPTVKRVMDEIKLERAQARVKAQAAQPAQAVDFDV